VRCPLKEIRDPQIEGVNQHKLCRNHTYSLEVYRLPTIVLQIVDPQHRRLHHLRKLGEEPLEVREERGIIKRPFRSLLKVPFLDWQAVGDSQPIPMNLEIR